MSWRCSCSRGARHCPHRRPSQGDGGVDVYEPVVGGYHVFQIKRFTESLSSGDKTKNLSVAREGEDEPAA